MKKNEIFQKAIDLWGRRSQLEMLQEESTELSLATRKFIREDTAERFDDLCSEIADVEIMIDQFKMMLPQSTRKIEEKKAFKLERLERRIKEYRK